MITRIMTAALGIPLVIGLVLFGGIWFQGAVLIVSLVGTYELLHAMDKKYMPMHAICYGAVLIYFLLFDFFGTYYQLYMMLVLVSILFGIVMYYPKYTVADAALSLFIPCYIGLLGFVLSTRKLPYGEFWIWLIFISAWGSDTFAYFSGVCFGKHPLAKTLSPKKTIEGSIGGVIGASLLAFIYSLCYTKMVLPEVHIFIKDATVLAAIGAILSQIGDLAASAMKRFLDKKDFGNILPGHGGIIDRFDSLLMIAPIIYVGVLIVQSVLHKGV